MGQLVQDARFGLRLLGKSPGFTVIAVLCLALGIGGNSAIFSVFNRIALQPLPYGTDEALVTIHTSFPGANVARNDISEPELEDLRQRLSTVDPIAAYAAIDANLEFTADDEPARVVTIVGDVSMFRALGVEPALGRDFIAREARPGSHLVVILSHRLWQTEYGGDPDVLGQTLQLDTEEHEIIGVMPEGFRFPLNTDADLFTPLALDPRHGNLRENHYLSAYARIADGETLRSVQGELDALAAELRVEYPKAYPAYTEFGLVATSVRDELFAPVRPAVVTLMLAVGIVLLIACANVASLLLARGMGRSGEIALRAALGAPRGRIVRQLLVESLVLALLGAAGGLLLALWGIDALVALGPEALPHLRTVGVDTTVLLFALGLSVVTGLAFGLAPALQVSRTSLTSVLNTGASSAAGGARATETRHSRGLRNLLMGAEIALALILLTGAGLAVKSLNHLERADLGFQSDQVMSMNLKLPWPEYPDADERLEFYGALFDRVGRGDGGVRVAAASHLPLSGSNAEYTCEIRGRQQDPFEVQIRVVTPDYFGTMGIPLVAGRDFAAHGANPEPGVVIDELLRSQHWGQRNPVGHKIRLSGDPTWYPIIGVVGTVRHEEGHTVAPHIYRSYTVRPQLRMTLVAKMDRHPDQLAAHVAGTVRQLDPNVALYDVKTMNQRVYESLAVYRFATVLLGVFAGFAMLLAVMGVYAVTAYTLAQRAREMALRLALGAQPHQLVFMLVRQGMRTAGAGIGAGLLLAPLMGWVLASVLFGVSWFDPLVCAAASAGVALASFVACFVAARHAVDVEPTLALRGE